MTGRVKLTEEQLRSIIRSVLSEGLATTDTLGSKYPFIAQDTLEVLRHFVWRYAADLAKSAGDKNKTREFAADVGMSLGAHLDDLTATLTGQAQNAQSKKPPPPSSSQSGRVRRQIMTAPPPPRRSA